MRKKIFWVTIIIVLIVVIFVALFYWQKGQQSPAVTKQSVLEINTPPTVKQGLILGRDAFGPEISPNGKWLLKEIRQENNDATENSGTKVDHSIILQSQAGQEDKTIFSLHEERTANFQPIKDVPYPTYWQPAGWSGDGLKVYFVTRRISSDCGGLYPEMTFAGSTLHEVEIASGKDRVLLQADTNYCGSNYGIHDVNAPKGLVLIEEPVGKVDDLKYNVYISDLTGGSKKLIATFTGYDGFSGAAMNPVGSRVALVNIKETRDENFFSYYLFVVDVATAKVMAAALPKVDTNYFIGWKDDKTIQTRLEGEYKEIVIP